MSEQTIELTQPSQQQPEAVAEQPGEAEHSLLVASPEDEYKSAESVAPDAVAVAIGDAPESAPASSSGGADTEPVSAADAADASGSSAGAHKMSASAHRRQSTLYEGELSWRASQHSMASFMGRYAEASAEGGWRTSYSVYVERAVAKKDKFAKVVLSHTDKPVNRSKAFQHLAFTLPRYIMEKKTYVNRQGVEKTVEETNRRPQGHPDPGSPYPVW